MCRQLAIRPLQLLESTADAHRNVLIRQALACAERSGVEWAVVQCSVHLGNEAVDEVFAVASVAALHKVFGDLVEAASGR